MASLVELLSYPFLQRALLGGLMSAVLLGWLGVFAISRGISFVGDGVAHASLGAIALALLIGWAPLPVAIFFAIVLAVLLYYLQHHTSVSEDAAIGMIFTGGMALGILLLQFYEGYVPELVSFLFGNILAVPFFDLVIMLVVGFVILFILFFFRKKFTFLILDPDGSKLAGIHITVVDILFYICIAVSVILSIKLIGIVLVSALLIIPSSFAKSLARSFFAFELIAVLVSVIMTVSGLLFSFILDLPSGATIVITGMGLFIISKIFRWAVSFH